MLYSTIYFVHENLSGDKYIIPHEIVCVCLCVVYVVYVVPEYHKCPQCRSVRSKTISLSGVGEGVDIHVRVLVVVLCSVF